jgi:signal transduction histidine kinase
MANRKMTASLAGPAGGSAATDPSHALWARVLDERDQQLRAQEEQLRALSSQLEGQRAQAAADADQWRRASEKKDEVLARVSHELRTPLNSLLALTALLREELVGPLTADQRQYLDVVQRSGQTLLHLVTGILDLSRLDAGHVDLQLQGQDVATSLRAVAAALAPLALTKGLRLIVDATNEIPLVRGDGAALQQVLTNLIGNAIKFTDKGVVTVGARTRGEWVDLFVTDTGAGIPDAARERIFDQFFQVDGDGRHDHAGSGLGLAIARRLARLMGGDITVSSPPGGGSQFTVSLARAVEPPAWAGTPPAALSSASTEKESRHGAHTPRR